MLVALTGGIAAGKSTVAGVFEELGGIVVDADALARRAVAPESPGLAAVVAEFGPEVLDASGGLDRAALASVVFDDESARRRLEAIIHPEVQRLSSEAFAVAVAQSPERIVIYDVPLLVEARRHHEFDRVVVVEAPDDIRIERLVSLRGMTRVEAQRRVSAQATNTERRALADYLIDTSGDIAATRQSATKVWSQLQHDQKELDR